MNIKTIDELINYTYNNLNKFTVCTFQSRKILKYADEVLINEL